VAKAPWTSLSVFLAFIQDISIVVEALEEDLGWESEDQ